MHLSFAFRALMNKDDWVVSILLIFDQSPTSTRLLAINTTQITRNEHFILIKLLRSFQMYSLNRVPNFRG